MKTFSNYEEYLMVVGQEQAEIDEFIRHREEDMEVA